ncbi:MAG: ABC transporter permease subunit, partial [Actinomycetia bacterium]|nr:ABC transporter permease subunit [Actinomycetes bacterium]
MIIRTILFEVVKDAIRKKILYFIFLLTFFLLALTPKLPSFEVGVQIALYRDISLGLSLISIVLLSIFLSVNQIPGEIEKKTIYNILSKPIKRYQFLIAKFLGILSILAL